MRARGRSGDESRLLSAMIHTTMVDGSEPDEKTVSNSRLSPGSPAGWLLPRSRKP
jgi:hypothetical protein